VTTDVRPPAKSQEDRLLPDDRLKHVLYLLKLCRYFDERMEALYRQGRLPGAIYSGRGQEGTHVGVAIALEPEDSLFPTHRDLSAQITKGLDLNRIMAQYWGRIDGYLRGRDGNSHIGDWFGNRTFAVISHLPIAYPVACGAALAYKRGGDGRVAMAICGDGSTSNGRWHEAINTSAIHRLPVVWVVNNNQYAYSTPNPLEFSVPTIAERAAAYGIPGARVDGADVLQVYAAAKEAVDRARDGRDPVKRFETWMLEHGIVAAGDVEEIQKRIEGEFEAGFEFAQASPFPEPGDVMKGQWVEDGYWTGEPGRGGGTDPS
jgi:TPP-dependent pyruvate/acetoin dehydrogenase alpha subunit